VTLFTYLAIAFSLVFSLAAVRLVGGLPSALAPARRSWVHVAFVFHELMRVAASFWVFWSYRDIAWSFGAYLLALVAPGLVYYLAATLVPEDPSHVLSWEDHYYEVRRRYFLGILGWTLALAATTTVLTGLPLLHPARVLQAAFAVFAITGAVSKSVRVHHALAAIAVALPLVAAFSDLLRLGSPTN
jgi:hypothetical protein